MLACVYSVASQLERSNASVIAAASWMVSCDKALDGLQ